MVILSLIDYFIIAFYEIMNVDLARSQGVVALSLPGPMQWWCITRAKSSGDGCGRPHFCCTISIMELTAYRQKLPKYIYTPDYQRAFLAITTTVQGTWTAGYVVWAGAIEDEIGGERSFNYGPYINDAPDLDAAVIQLFHEYQKWRFEGNT
jgi:hypothetical protein